MNVLRRLVYVSGAPGSGKSTLAAPLAAELGYALLGKDIIKETLHGVLGPPDLDRARSRELGAASMEDSASALRASCCYLTLATADEDSGPLRTRGCTKRSTITPLARAMPLSGGPGVRAG